MHTHHEASFSFKTTSPGTDTAVAYCSMHGLWEASERIELNQPSRPFREMSC